MKKYDLFEAIQLLKNRIESQEFFLSARSKDTAFSRNRKMPFLDVVCFMLATKRHCIQRELNTYLHQIGKDTVTRQAFRKSRENIRPDVFRELTQEIVKDFEQKDESKATYKGYRLIAIDGSVLSLPNTDVLRERFGVAAGTDPNGAAKAKAILAVDVLNHVVVWNQLYKYTESEITLIHKIIEDIHSSNHYKDSILLLDRGYPSFQLFREMQELDRGYVVRVSSSFIPEINKTFDDDKIITITRKGTSCEVRVVNFILPSGEREQLVTNVFELSYDEIVHLYTLRWGVESVYNTTKHTLILESFTGESITAILQDFYIAVMMLNFAAFAFREQQDILDQHGKGLKHRYKPNKREIISKIKTNFVKLLMAKSRRCRAFRQFVLYKEIQAFAYAHRENRSFSRGSHTRNSLRKPVKKTAL
ncbi:MAG TPA: IS4 family transposase [Bacteroidales bacterium]|nr:IS4 family transposase [Bacteroidales bacterium]